MKRILLALLASAAFVGVAAAQIVAPNISSQPVITASSGSVSAATSTATLAAPNAGSWEITQLEVTGSGTAGVAVACTITGLMGGTMTIDMSPPTVGTATLQPAPPSVVPFNGGLTALPATAVVFSCPSFGAGAIAINIHGILVH